MKKQILILFATLLLANKLLLAQSLPKPDHVVIVIEENQAYDEIIGDVTDLPYINSLATDPDAALITNSYALTHPSQPNYLWFFSGDDQGVYTDDISGSQFTTCNLGAELLDSNYSFIGYSEDLPSNGYLGESSTNGYARKHNPWSNWQGSSSNNIPASSNIAFSGFPSDFSSLPTVSFVIPNLDDDMHDGTPNQGDVWLQNNLDSYIQWAKSNNSLFILTFDEDDGSSDNHIVTIFLGSMVKGGSYSDTIIHTSVLRTIEDMYNLSDCSNSASVSSITNIWNSNTGINQLSPGDNQLSIYPNPANGIINITSSKNIDEIKVINLLGQTMLESTLGDLRVTGKEIDLSNLSAGMYFVTVTSGDEIETQKIIVSR